MLRLIYCLAFCSRVQVLKYAAFLMTGYTFASRQSSARSKYCPPPFRRKAEGHSFCLSVFPPFRPSISPSFRPPTEVGTLWAQLLLKFYTDSFETSLVFWSWSEDMHVVWIYSADYFLSKKVKLIFRALSSTM